MKNVFAIILITSAMVTYGQRKEIISPLKLEFRILDQANLLTAKQKHSIFLLIQDLEKQVGSQLAILTVQSLNGQTIQLFSMNEANKMGLGRKAFKDGILIVYAINEGQVRIEVGKGLNQIITDDIATIINESILAPQFRAQNYAGGFYNAVKAIKERIEADRASIGKRP
jgi:uncharacterized protein